MRGRKAAGAGKKAAAAVEEDEEHLSPAEEDEDSKKEFADVDERNPESSSVVTIETPSFSPLARSGPPEPLHQNKKLKWDHKVCAARLMATLELPFK